MIMPLGWILEALQWDIPSDHAQSLAPWLYRNVYNGQGLISRPYQFLQQRYLLIAAPLLHRLTGNISRYNLLECLHQ
jgi:hypothetical protein